MNIFHDLNQLPKFKNAVITSGSFDGVHQGHQKMIQRINELAKAVDGESVVISFDPHPRQVIYPNDDTLRLLTSTAEKLKYFEELGIDNAVVLPFTIEFSQLHAREYIENFLIEKFNPKCLVVGYDHRFGLNREGNYSLLKQYSDRGEFDLVQISKQEVTNITVSSTKIRASIADGDIEQANQLLGHNYNIRGTVIHGEKLGEKLGYPTANIQLDNPIKLLPPDGIYAVYAEVNGDRHEGMLYIGDKPTISKKQGNKSIEVNLFDFNQDIYGQTIELHLIAFVREDRALANLEELTKAIEGDKRQVETIIAADKLKHIVPETAVVALNYNGARVLPIYLPSFALNSKNAHVYIADNGSTDNSVDFVEQNFPSFKLIRLTDNHGYAGGYNQALENLDYKYLALINTDIELTKGWLDPMIQILESNPNVAAVQPKILAAKNKTHFEYAGACGGYMDRLGYPFCAGRILNDVEEDNGQYDQDTSIFWASGAAFVIRTDVFKALGGFDGDYFAHMEEIDLCWRIRRAGFDIRYSSDSVVYHEGGATLPYNSARKVFLNFRNNLATLIKNLTGFQMLGILPIRFALDALAGVHFLVQGKISNCWAIVRAYFAVIAWLPSLIRKRKEDKKRISKISVGPNNYKGYYKGSIIWQYYALGNRTFSKLKDKYHEST